MLIHSDILDTDSLVHKMYFSKERLITLFVRSTQFVTWPCAFIVFRSLFKIDIRGREYLRTVHSPFIIISNHISFYDSFLFRLVLGFATPHLPLRFMAVNRFRSKMMNTLFAIGVIDLVYALFGVFTVVPKKGIEENLKKPITIIRQGGTVVIYPEGMIVTTDAIGHFKNGAALLAQHTGVPVLPVSFRFGERLFLRRRLHIHIGRPHTVDTRMPCSEVSHMLEQEVRTLFETR